MNFFDLNPSLASYKVNRYANLAALEEAKQPEITCKKLTEDVSIEGVSGWLQAVSSQIKNMREETYAGDENVSSLLQEILEELSLVTVASDDSEQNVKDKMNEFYRYISRIVGNVSGSLYQYLNSLADTVKTIALSTIVVSDDSSSEEFSSDLSGDFDADSDLSSDEPLSLEDEEKL